MIPDAPACPRCGGALGPFEEGSAVGMRCGACGWSVVRTNMPEIVLDKTEYIVNLANLDPSMKNVSAISEARNINFVAARSYIREGHTEVTRGLARDIDHLVERCRELDLKIHIFPDYKYE